MKITTPIAVASMLIVLAGCGGGSDPVTEPEPESGTSSAPAPSDEPDPEGLTEEDLVAYFEQVFSGTGERQQEAEPLTAPGSPAARYLAFQAGFAASAVDSGTSAEPSEVSATDGGVEACTNGTDCTAITEVKTQNGRVSNFEVDGTPFADRVIGGSRPQQIGDGASVQLLGALRSLNSGALLVAFKVSTGDSALGLDSTAYGASYREASGRQIQVAEAQVGRQLQPGSSSTVALSFPGADLGGTLALDVVDADGYSDGDPVMVSIGRP